MHRMSAVVLCCLACTARAVSAQNQVQVQSLAGLGAIHVIMEEVGPDAVYGGLDTARVRNAVELDLRRSGLLIDNAAAPFLDIGLVSLRAGSGGFAYGYSLALHQPVTLATGAPGWGVTWTVNGVGMCPPSDLNSAVLETFSGLTTRFLNDWFTANPRR